MGIFDAWKSTKPTAATPSGPPLCTPFARDVLRGGGPGAHHGIPQDATCIVHDASSGCVAAGTSRGLIKVFGRNGIELLLFDPESWTGSDYTSSSSERSLQIPVHHLCWLGYSGSHLLAVFRNGTIQVWDVASRSILGSLGQGWAGCGVHCVAAHPWPNRQPSAANDDSRSQLKQQGAYAYLGGDNGTVYVLKCWPEVRLCTGYVVARNDAIASNASTGAGDSSSEEDEAAADEEENADEVVAISVNPLHEGTLLIAYSRSGVVLWDLEDRQTIRRLRRHPSKPNRGGAEGSDAFSGSSGGGDGSGSESVTCACWHPEGAHIAVGYDDGSFEVWSLASGSSSWSVASLRRNLLGPLTGSSGSSSLSVPPPQRVTAAGLQLPPRLLEGGMDLADLDLGDGTPTPLLKLEFLPPAAPGQACALLVLGGVSRPVVASARAGTRAGMGGSIMFACAHALLPEAAAVHACALACAAAATETVEDGGGSDGRARSSSLRSSAGGNLRDSDGALPTSSPGGLPDEDGGGISGVAPKKREMRASRMWGAVSGAMHAGGHHSHPHGSSGHDHDSVDMNRLSLDHRTSSGSEIPVHADPGGAYRCVASFAAADGDALDLAAVSLNASSPNKHGNDGIHDFSGYDGQSSSATLVAALVGVRGTVDVLASHWPWPQKEPTPVALPGPLPCASLSGDMISTLVTDVNIPPAVWPRFLSASTATEAATSGTGTAGGGRDGEVLAQPKGTNRRTAEAPAALLRLGAWDTRSSSSGGGGGAKEVAKGDETSSGGAIAALPPAVSAPFSVVAVAHADGCVSVNALTRDAWPDDDLFQTNLHLAKKLEMSFDHDSEDEERDGSDTDDDDDDDDDDNGEHEHNKAAASSDDMAPCQGLREGGRSSFSLTPQKRTTARATPSKTTTPAALALARIDVNALLADGDHNNSSSSSGLLRISAVRTLMTRALVAVGVGGEHPCAGQTLLVQLVRRHGGTGSSYWEHGGNGNDGGGGGGAAVIEPECKEVEAVLEGAGAQADATMSLDNVTKAPASVGSAALSPSSSSSSSSGGEGDADTSKNAQEENSKRADTSKDEDDEDDEDRDSLDELDAEIDAARQAASLNAQIASPVSDAAVLAAAEAADGARGAAHSVEANDVKSEPKLQPASSSSSKTGGSQSLPNEDFAGSHLWAWRKVYAVDAGHAAAPRCLALAEDTTTTTGRDESSSDGRDSSSGSKGGNVIVAVADGVGAVSVTLTGSGRTRVSPAGPGRGGIVQLMSGGRLSSGVRDQRVVCVAFDRLVDPSTLLVGLACGEVQILCAHSARLLAVLPATPAFLSPLATTSTTSSSNTSAAGQPSAPSSSSSSSSFFGGSSASSTSSSGVGGCGSCVLAYAFPWAGPVGSTPPCLVAAGQSLSLFGATSGGSSGSNSSSGGGAPRATAPLLASIALGSALNTTLVAATVLDPVQAVASGHGALVLLVDHAWTAYLVAVDHIPSPYGTAAAASPPTSAAAANAGNLSPGGGSSSAREGGKLAKPTLTVLGGKALKPPGGVPPWDALSTSGNSGTSTAAAAAAPLAYDKKVEAAGGGAYQADDAETESGGPGRRLSLSPWGDLVSGGYGSGEFLRQSLVDWPAFVALGAPLQALSDMGGSSGGGGGGGNSSSSGNALSPLKLCSPSGSGLVADGGASSGTIDLTSVLQANIGVNTGPTFSARFPPPPSLKARKSQASLNAPAGAPTDENSLKEEKIEEVSSLGGGGGRRRALTVGSSSSNDGPIPMMALPEVDDEEGEGEGAESSSSDLSRCRSDPTSGASAPNLLLSSDQPSSSGATAGAASLSAAAAAGKKTRRASLGGAMSWALAGGSGAAMRRSRSDPSSPSSSSNTSTANDGSDSFTTASGGTGHTTPLQQARPLDLAALFDVFVPTTSSSSSSTSAELLANSSGESAAVDLASFTPEERTKRLLEARGEALKQTDQKAKLMAEGAQQYRDNAARLKAETKKSANNIWPF